MKTLACLRRLYTFNRLAVQTRLCTRSFHITQESKEKDSNKRDDAIPFSSSKAASWSSLNSFGPPAKEMPVHQPIIVCLSVGIFLAYFLFLREENDFDIELNQTLFERVPGLEESHLRAAINQNHERGNDTIELEKRLSELLAKKIKSP